MTRRRLLVAAAGSGGHIYPGLAVARAFAELAPAEVRFVGAPGGLESRLVPENGFALEVVAVPSLRSRSISTIPAVGFRLLAAIARMRRLIRDFRPDAVFGTGGSVSGVAVLAARLAGVPSMILEPNAEPGLANRCSARFANTIAVGWEATRAHFSREVMVSGIPIRPEFDDLAPPPGLRNGFPTAAGAPANSQPNGSAGQPLSVLVTGGSQGASRLNRMVTEALPELGERAAQLTFTHQTGRADEKAVRAAYREHGILAEVVAYLDDMPAAVEAADLVVGRAGAITCAELAAAGRPAIVSPAPVAGAHQNRNAEALAAAGAAVILKDGASGVAFAAALTALLDDPRRRAAMATAAHALSRPGAKRPGPAERIARRLAALAGGDR